MEHLLCYAQEYKINKDKAPKNFLELAEDESLLKPFPEYAECEVFEVTNIIIGNISYNEETGILRREVNLTVETDNEDLEERDVVGVHLDSNTLHMIDGKWQAWQKGCDMDNTHDTDNLCEFWSEEY